MYSMKIFSRKMSFALKKKTNVFGLSEAGEQWQPSHQTRQNHKTCNRSVHKTRSARGAVTKHHRPVEAEHRNTHRGTDRLR